MNLYQIFGRSVCSLSYSQLFQPAPAAKKAAPKDTKAQKAQQKATKNVSKAAPRVGGKR